MADNPINSIEELADIPRRVFETFFQEGGLRRINKFEYFTPIKNTWFDANNAQEIVDRQRQNFKSLIAELFPTDEVEAFIRFRIDRANFPNLSKVDMNEKFADVIRTLLHDQRLLSISPFDLDSNRAKMRIHGYFDRREIYFMVRLMSLRPATALSILFFRKFLVEWAYFLKLESHKVLPIEWRHSFDFFCNSWNQNSYFKFVYPAVALHLHDRVDMSKSAVKESEFNRPLMNEVMVWLTVNHVFWGKANRANHGHNSKISCSAAGFLIDGIGKKGWINLIFDRIVECQNDPLMVTDLSRVKMHAAALLGTIPDPHET